MAARIRLVGDCDEQRIGEFKGARVLLYELINAVEELNKNGRALNIVVVGGAVAEAKLKLMAETEPLFLNENGKALSRHRGEGEGDGRRYKWEGEKERKKWGEESIGKAIERSESGRERERSEMAEKREVGQRNSSKVAFQRERRERECTERERVVKGGKEKDRCESLGRE